MQEVDRLMIAAYHITLVQMMENAGRNLADLAQTWLDGHLLGQPILVLCGRGNNGGGGLAAARHLANRGAAITLVTAHPAANYNGAALHQLNALERLGLPMLVAEREQAPVLPPAALILDAMIGYGLRGNPRGASRGMIEAANQHGAPILSLDTPSGLETTTGEVFDPCIRASATMTLALPKVGLLGTEADSVIGRLFVADISVPPVLYAELGIQVRPLFASSPVIELL
jgi:NAD(P)H-hydrate epimerase